MKLIKKSILSVLMVTVLCLCNIQNLYAASFNVSVRNNKNGSLTVTVSGQVVGGLSVSAGGKTSTLAIRSLGGSDSATIKTGAGTFTVVVTAISLSDADYNVIEGEKVVEKITVTDDSSSSGSGSNNGGGNSNGGSGSSSSNGNTNSSTPDTRSKDNTLSSLSVSTGELSPTFSSDKTSYSVGLTSETEKINIDAKAKDSKAKVSGTGEKSLVIGNQTFEVVVTAENGSKKTYVITVTVTEKPTVFTQYGEEKLGVLIDLSKVEAPAGYSGVNVTLEGTTVTGWTSEKTGLTLAYLINEKGEKNFYIVEDGKVVGKYEILTILGKQYTLLNIPSDMEKQNGLKLEKIKIGDVEVQGWTFEDKTKANYSVLYLMNDVGEKGLYSYDGTEGTLQKYVPTESSTNNNTLTYVFIGTTALFAITTGVAVAMYLNFKKKSISAIKDYYDSKNQSE